MSITIVAAVGSNGVIGRDGDLPWRIPHDLRQFKALTAGHTLIMGRKTYESIGRPLPDRSTIVVTRRPDWRADGVLVAHSFPEAIHAAADAEIFIAGGGEIYRAALEVADRMRLTEVDQSPDGDAYFPEWDRAAWTAVTREQHAGYAFVTYHRVGDSDDG